ncbi:MAG TPA: cell division topological specificity factor MinE [Cellvibrio sp.]|nr:cell division topological specificity factor MinE [Cellvibrio sp.]
MSFFDYFRKKSTPSSASLAKERLQIIVAHERHKRTQPEFLAKMQQEIIDVIRKYIKIDSDQVVVSLDESDNCSVLELNITLPE